MVAAEMLAGHCAAAQDSHVSVSYGIFAKNGTSALRGLYRPEGTEVSATRSTGSFTASYTHKAGQVLQIGGVLGYACAAQDVAFKSGSAYTHQAHSVALIARLDAVWLRRRWVEMYSGLGAGLDIVREKGQRGFHTSVHAAGQLTAVGIRAGGAVYGYAEAGWGTLGALNVGLGYRF